MLAEAWLIWFHPSALPNNKLLSLRSKITVTIKDVVGLPSVDTGPSKMTYVYNGIRVKWSHIKWYTRSICTLLYMNFDGLYIIMNSPYRSLCTKFIIYAIILYGDQIVRRSFFMAPYIYSGVFTGVPKVSRIISFFVRPFFSPPSLP